MSKPISIESVRQAVKDTVEDVVKDFKDLPDTGRETLIKRLDEECDTLWGNLVCHGLITKWNVDDLVNHAEECSVIIKTADADAWVEDDRGLWEGVTYGTLGVIAFYSLRNLLYKAMADAGHDSNDDPPFAPDGETEEDEPAE